MSLRSGSRLAISVPAILLAGALLGLNLLFERALREEIEVSTEMANQTFARVFVNQKWEGLQPLLAREGGVDPRANPYLRDIDMKVREFARGTDLVKVKIYDPRGMTVYSSDPDQIGEDKSGNAGFLSAARGRTVSELTFRGKFGSFDGELYQRNLISSYVPVRGPSGVEAVVEIYTDRTASIESLERQRRTLMLWVTPFALGIGVVLVGLARRWRHRVSADQARDAAAAARPGDGPDDAESPKKSSQALFASLAHEWRPLIETIVPALERASRAEAVEAGALIEARDAAHVLRRRAEWLALLAGQTDGPTADARSGSGVEPVAQVRVALEAVAPRARAKGLDLQSHLGLQPGWPVVGTAAEVGAILESLLLEAVDATDSGYVQVRVNASQQGVQFDIVDSGRPRDARSGSAELGEFRQVLANGLVARLGGSLKRNEGPERGGWVTLVLPFAEGPDDARSAMADR